MPSNRPGTPHNQSQTRSVMKVATALMRPTRSVNHGTMPKPIKPAIASAPPATTSVISTLLNCRYANKIGRASWQEKRVLVRLELGWRRHLKKKKKKNKDD